MVHSTVPQRERDEADGRGMIVQALTPSAARLRIIGPIKTSQEADFLARCSGEMADMLALGDDGPDGATLFSRYDLSVRRESA
jgi:hypothetical protein